MFKWLWTIFSLGAPVKSQNVFGINQIPNRMYFCHLSVFRGSETVFCYLLQRIASMEMDWNLNKLGWFVKFLFSKNWINRQFLLHVYVKRQKLANANFITWTRFLFNCRLLNKLIVSSKFLSITIVLSFCYVVI